MTSNAETPQSQLIPASENIEDVEQIMDSLPNEQNSDNQEIDHVASQDRTPFTVEANHDQIVQEATPIEQEIQEEQLSQELGSIVEDEVVQQQTPAEQQDRDETNSAQQDVVDAQQTPSQLLSQDNKVGSSQKNGSSVGVSRNSGLHKNLGESITSIQEVNENLEQPKENPQLRQSSISNNPPSLDVDPADIPKDAKFKHDAKQEDMSSSKRLAMIEKNEEKFLADISKKGGTTQGTSNVGQSQKHMQKMQSDFRITPKNEDLYKKNISSISSLNFQRDKSPISQGLTALWRGLSTTIKTDSPGKHRLTQTLNELNSDPTQFLMTKTTNFSLRDSSNAVNSQPMGSNLSEVKELADMNLAKVTLKMMEHHQELMKARMVKLTKEEEKTSKRIKDQLKQKAFMKQMQEEKINRMLEKHELAAKHKNDEALNRERIRQQKFSNRSMIERRKTDILNSNKSAQLEIIKQEAQLKRKVAKNRIDSLAEKQSFAKFERQEYTNNIKRRRNMSQANYGTTQVTYHNRIGEIYQTAQKIQEMTSMMEDQEREYLLKLQMTQNREKRVARQFQKMKVKSMAKLAKVKGTNPFEKNGRPGGPQDNSDYQESVEDTQETEY